MKNNIDFKIILTLALFLGLIWGANRHMHNSGFPNYTSFSYENAGVSLLHDTLQHMGYPIALLYRPAQTVDINAAVFIIQPVNPRIDYEMTHDILLWVRRGGRLFYLDNRYPTAMDQILDSEYREAISSMRLYQVGMGEVITGPADIVANANLMGNYFYGEGITYILSRWNPDRIYFAEYYHGFHAASGMFRQMPLWLRLVTFQIIIGAVALMWHLGKRFGNPIPLYEEIEREENEQVLVLARLYKHAKK